MKNSCAKRLIAVLTWKVLLSLSMYMMFDTLVQCQYKTTRYHGNKQKQHGLIVPESCLPLSLSALSVTSPKSYCVLMNSTVAHTLRKRNGINKAVNRANWKVVNTVVRHSPFWPHTLYSRLSAGQTAITPIHSIDRGRGGAGGVLQQLWSTGVWIPCNILSPHFTLYPSCLCFPCY